MRFHILAATVGLLATGAAFAQGYPPQMTPNGGMIQGFSVNPMNSPFWGNQRGVNDVVRGTHQYTDPQTGYVYQRNNNTTQWRNSGNRSAETWGNGPPPGMGWYQLNR